MDDEEIIAHGADFCLKHIYDPVKAREYYLRTRKLKGRQPGSKEAPKPRNAANRATVGQRPKGAVAKTQKKIDTKAATEARVKALKSRLEKLRSVLKELVEQAQKRSGIDVKEEASKKEPDKKDNKPQTAAEKREAKKQYEERKKKAGTEEHLRAEIAKVSKKIAEAREKLKDSVMKARQKAAETKPATKAEPKPGRNSQNGSRL